MRARLLKDNSLLVGEIGIDHLKNIEVDKEKQKQVFEAQLDLAIELNRDVVIHCVRAHNDLLKILSKKFAKKKTLKVSEKEYLEALEFVQSIPKEVNRSEMSKKSLKKLVKMEKKIQIFVKYQDSKKLEDKRPKKYVT